MLTETQKIFNTLEDMSRPKVIKYYTRNEFGNIREFVHPDNIADGKILHQLTGKRCLNSVTRELIRDLTGGKITFIEVPQPSTLA